MRILPIVVTLVVLVLWGAAWSCGARADDGGTLGALVASPWWLVLIVPALIAGLWLLGRLLHVLAQLARERLHASRVARLLELLASLADDASETLANHPPAPAATLLAVRASLVAQGVAYAKSKLSDTIAAIGIDDETLAARLSRSIATALNTHGLQLPVDDDTGWRTAVPTSAA